MDFACSNAVSGSVKMTLGYFFFKKVHTGFDMMRKCLNLFYESEPRFVMNLQFENVKRKKFGIITFMREIFGLLEIPTTDLTADKQVQIK